MKITAADAAGIVRGRLIQGRPGNAARGVSTDSRTIEAGEGFIALSGERFDGNRFAPEAVKRGAAWVIMTDPAAAARLPGPAAVIIVDDALIALGLLAADHRGRHRAKVAAITGSLGKSTTKEMIAAVLGAKGQVLKNEGNLNNRIGVPRTLFQLTGRHDFAVLELGCNEPGEIARLTAIARPDAGLITRVAPVHLAGLGSLAGVARAKAELIGGLGPGAAFILNLDDPLIVASARGFKGRVIGLSADPGRKFKGESLHLLELEKDVAAGQPLIRFRIQLKRGGKASGPPVAFVLNALARHRAGNALAAAAMGRAFGVELAEAAARLHGVKGLAGRGEVVKSRRGVFVVNDAYNSSPEAVAGALETLAWWKGPRRGAAVLGEMLELGRDADKYHRAAGRKAAETGMALLIAVGPSADLMAAAARAAGMPREAALAAADADEAARLAGRFLGKGDWVLVKGSHAIGLDRVAAALAR
jgi:UDP-N-acetylmuramoyl-tripeptide--D-alanyl-D-alanine ligase